MGVDVDCSFQTLDRFINVLQSGTKREKKAALEELTIIVDKAEGDVLAEVHGKLQNQLILSFQDPVEAVREGCLLLSWKMIEKLEPQPRNISLLLPALYPRVCREKDPENSEELRLIIAKFLITTVEKYDKMASPYMTELVDMICRLLKDPAPEIKCSASSLLTTVVTLLPAECFQFTKKLWPPLVENLNHQRWRVRVSTVEALEWLMIKGDNKCVPEVTPALNKKMLDSMHQVRLALVKLAGRWMVKLRDRYSFFPHLMPILLGGLADDNDDVVGEARTLWEAAGEQYLRENDKDLKDKINYEPEHLDHYPPGVKRPSLGCRVLIEREATKFLLALVNELNDWVEIVRIKSSMLLTQVILHFEQSITMSIRKIIAPICKAAKDRETPLVAANVKVAAEYMGYFVPADVYCKLIVEYMKEAHEGELVVVAGMVRGTKRSDLADHLDKIATLLENTTFKGREQLGLLDLIESLMTVCQSDVFNIGDEMWSCLVSVAGLAEDDVVRKKAVELLERFSELGGGNKREVYGRHCAPLLEKLPNTVWTVHCHEQFILLALINVTGEIVGDHVDAFIAILKSAMKPGNDPEVLLKVTMAVNDLLSNPDVTLPTPDVTAKFIRAMLAELLPPHLEWSAGRSAEAIRTVACTCLYMCLCKVSTQEDNVTSTSGKGSTLAEPISKIKITDVSELPASGSDVADEEESPPRVDFSGTPAVIYGLGGYLEPLLPLIMSLVQDAAPKTRLLALNCAKVFAKTRLAHQPPHFSTIIAQVLKRLDDADKSVRAASVDVLKHYYAAHPTSAEHVNKTMADFVYATLLIHLDDKDPDLKLRVLECLKTASDIDPRALRSKVAPDNFRDKDVCQRLIVFLEEKIKCINRE